MQQAGQGHVVALATLTVAVDQVLGHQKQRDATGTGRSAFDPRQHHVHDVVGQLVVTTGNEHLLPEQAVAAVVGRAGEGAQIAKGRALARFGQGHGAAETAIEHRRQKALAQGVAGKALDQVGSADGQERVGHGGDIGGIEISHAGAQDDFRQLQAAVVGIMVGGEETGLGEGVPGNLGFRNQGDFFTVEGGLLGVAFLVVRGEIFGGDAASGF
ncbi:hypothetical protein D3C78_1154840 [compost metagenome]